MRIDIKIGNFLYKYSPTLYNFFYSIFKNQQDKHEILFLEKSIQKNDTVIDIGANIGFYSKIISKLVGPNGKVYSFEPDNINFERLVKNTASYSNIINSNTAVSDLTKVINLYKSPLLNVDHRTYPIEDATDIIQINAVSLDEYLGFDFKVSFIKIDIQGYEYYAFKGMKNILLNNPNIVILSEFWPYGILKSNSNIHDFFNLIYSYNLNIYKLVGNQFVIFKEEDVKESEIIDSEYYTNIIIKK